jgi:hypothetical protein
MEGGLSITNGAAELLSVANNPKYSESGSGHGSAPFETYNKELPAEMVQRGLRSA